MAASSAWRALFVLALASPALGCAAIAGIEERRADPGGQGPGGAGGNGGSASTGGGGAGGEKPGGPGKCDRSAPNALSNPSFETWGMSGPTQWFTEDGSMSEADPPPRDLSRAVHVELAQNGDLRQDVDTTPGPYHVTVSVWVRFEFGNELPEVYIDAQSKTDMACTGSLDNVMYFQLEDAPPGEWAEICGDVDLPDNSCTARFALSAPGAGTTIFDVDDAYMSVTPN